jgi:hypothetical protein
MALLAWQCHACTHLCTFYMKNADDNPPNGVAIIVTSSIKFIAESAQPSVAVTLVGDMLRFIKRKQNDRR